MRRVIAIAAAGLSLTGCTSFSSSDPLPSLSDALSRPPPAALQLQLVSTPPGANALTSLGPGCTTPCSVALQAPETGFSTTSEFTISYTMDGFLPATMVVQVVHVGGSLAAPPSTKINPNPVVAVLQAVAPTPNPTKKMIRPDKPAKNSVVDPSAPPRASAAQELERLHALLVRGVISQTDFDSLKAKLLRSSLY
ncbi:SHOCT domain-containing protein [Bradyrhizobium sp. CCGUVB23]|uniref:SHOCT domain-containing protein n=1 Tax=Bradyrhizobium sp. CCGUVB23 TaxID=2949630 RepID=UPI0020B18A16|nr:SHOCT domain-containing protein [Bradyrhizobium sp. CCGUVB23]MCP3461054.1 SHOCT domain-containing protein [Bradyrhizobium sp. CCGUVB23]